MEDNININEQITQVCDKVENQIDGLNPNLSSNLIQNSQSQSLDLEKNVMRGIKQNIKETTNGFVEDTLNTFGITNQETQENIMKELDNTGNFVFGNKIGGLSQSLGDAKDLAKMITDPSQLENFAKNTMTKTVMRGVLNPVQNMLANNSLGKTIDNALTK